MPLPALPDRWRRELAVVSLLLLAVLAGWMTSTGRWRAAAWSEPLAYEGDALYYFAMAKASAESHAWPFLWKRAERLNAPYGADWNDFPIVNEPLWSLLGVSRKVFGLAGVSLFPVLLAHLLAAAGFYVAARCWSANRWCAAAMALLFALSPYLLRRSFVHLNLAFAWHLPLAVVVGLWASQAAGLQSRRRFLLALAVAVVSGLQATYYALFFLLVLGGALVSHLLARRYGDLRRPSAVALLAIGLAAAGNLDTLTFAWVHGDNPGAVQRGLADVEVFSLKPVELFLPRNGLLGGALAATIERRYVSQLPTRGEVWASYLGAVAGGALLVLLASAFASLLLPRQIEPAPEAWVAVAGIAFAVSGGGNTALAIAGVQLFRAGGRVSVLLLAVALLYAARSLSAWRPRRQALALLLLLPIGLGDQLPRPDLTRQQLAARQFAADARFAAELEQRMPGGRIFQLPVALYPEAPRLHQLEPYELLRLYSHSWSLQFTYGAHKGRGFERWQRDLLTLPWPAAIARLEQLGFSAVAVHGRGYADNGDALVAALEAAGGGPTLAAGAPAIRVVLLPGEQRSAAD